MRILSFTGGAGQMYCGSCLRDNALASALIARGHDVVLTPVYTPTRTDERNVSQHQVVFGGISVFLEQHSSHLPAHAARARSPVGRRVGHQAGGEASDQGRPAEPRRDDGLDAPRRQGFQRKEIAKLIDWLKTEPRFDVINLPYTLLLGLAEPLKRTLNTPICCTLQGEDLFLDGLGEPWKQQSMDLIRAASAHVDAFLPVSRYYLDYMPGYLGVPREKMRLVPLGINLDGYTPRPRAASGAVHDRVLRADCAREGPARARRCVSPAAHAPGHRPLAPRGRRVSRAGAPRVSRRHHERSERVGSPGTVRVSRRGRPRAEDRLSCAASTCCRCRRPTRSRRASSCSKRWPTACPSSSRAAARFPRSSRPPAAVSSWRRTIPRRWPMAFRRCGRIRRAPPRLARPVRRRPAALQRGPDGRVRRKRVRRAGRRVRQGIGERTGCTCSALRTSRSPTRRRAAR